MSWLEFIKIVWPIASVITPILIGAGLLWLRSQFTTKAEMAAKAAELGAQVIAAKETLNDHETRLRLLEQDAQRPPSRIDLFEKMTAIESRTGSIEGTLEGLEKQFENMNEYLRTLIERGLSA